jgi:molecular chaperone DnaJ
MSTTKRDYYELLGIARAADDAEIKRAFRRKARELHPDVSDAPDSEIQFREVVEAYEVLSKSETRELYDRFGHAGLKGGNFNASQFDFGSLTDLFSAFFGDDLFGAGGRPRRARGQDVAAEVEIELLEAASGVKRDVPYEVVVGCERCSGEGAEPGTGTSVCDACGGTGRLQQVGRSVLGEFVRSQTCPHCGGNGRLVEHPCADCGGSGRTVELKSLPVEIPPGIHDGQRIRVSGAGHAGSLGGPAGDVYVRVRVKRDLRFVREGDDVYSTIDLTIVEAAIGATRTIETLEGELALGFDAGTQPGQIRVLSGRGMPVLQGLGRGDHRVLVNVVVPRRLSEEQLAVLEEFGRLTGEENYQPDEGFFDKLKSAFR